MGRISTRLWLIIVACLLPALALYATLGWSLWSDRKAQLDDLVVQQARLLAGDVDGITGGARILLAAADVFCRDQSAVRACDSRMAELSRVAPAFSFIAMVDNAGHIAAASVPNLIGPTEDTGWAAQAGGATGFTAGHYARSADRPGGFVPFYLPVIDHAVRVGTLVTALDLNWLEHHLLDLKRASSRYLAAGILTVVDSDGVILGRDVRHADFAGKPLPPAAAPVVRSDSAGVVRLTSIDGTARLVGYSPPAASGYGLAVAVGFFEPDLMADVHRALTRWSVVLAAMTTASFILAMYIARQGIARPAQDLVAVAHRWREGDLTARAAAGDARSQFGQIATAFNEMAATLQSREDKLRRHAMSQESQVAARTRELVVANERLRQEMEDRRTAQASLLQVQKLQAVGQLAGGIAHDYNNILQTVAGSVGLIRRRVDDPPTVARMATMIEDAVRRGTSITGRLLAFARRDDAYSGSVNVGDLLSGLREVLAATLGAGVRVTVDAGSGLPPVQADGGQLEAVLVNLATNGRDAMPSGGRLEIRADAGAVADSEALCGLKPGPYVRLSVSDTGQGMDAETLAHAAEPFFTTKPKGQGTGLGLAMARGFAEQCGGKLSIDSTPGQGTTVTLWLPARPAAAAEPGPPARAGSVQAAGWRPGRIGVLLVDDDDGVRDVLAIQLRDEGFEVTEANSGEAALGLLDRIDSWDVVVTDLIMTGMDGITLLREARRVRPGLPAILLTGSAADETGLVSNGIAGPDFRLLRKPIGVSQLLEQLAALLPDKAGMLLDAGHSVDA